MDKLRAEGEREALSNARCYRCGRNPQTEHENGFCPAFADYGESGTRLQLSSILRSLRQLSKRPLSVWTTSRVEEHEGPGDEWHYIVGIAVGDKYVARLDAPWMPEFSIYKGSRRVYDADHGTVAASASHTVLYRGWRLALRDAARACGIPLQTLGRALGVALQDRTTEEVARFKVGYL